MEILVYTAGYKINGARLELGFVCFGICPSYKPHQSTQNLMCRQLAAFLEAS